MPIYHFHVHDGRAWPDAEGTEFPDLVAARGEAANRIAALLQDDAETFWNGEPWRMEIANSDGLTLLTVMFLATISPLADADS